MHPPVRPRSPLFVVLGLALAFGLAAGAAIGGCGPKEKFCPNTTDGVCPAPHDAAPKDLGVEAPPMDMGSIYVGADSGT
jgi:hypothetical protein